MGMNNEELKMKNQGKNFLKDKSFAFSVDVVNLYKKLTEYKEFVMSKQMLRSGTAVGALVREAEFAQSKPDFISKLSIALKRLMRHTTGWSCCIIPITLMMILLISM
jgi:hypothetical protein